jgi:uncharacterized membrane protein YdbT with pleckstrin-like domain
VVQAEPGEVVFFHGHPSWLSLAAFYFKGLLATLGLGVIAGLVSAAGSGQVQVMWVVLVVLLAFIVVITSGQLRRMQTTYSITNRRLTIESGLLSRRLHQTRLERVQNVNATQTLLQRLVWIGTVDFDTAGESDFEFAFRGVSDPRGIVRTVDRALHEMGPSQGSRASAGL